MIIISVYYFNKRIKKWWKFSSISFYGELSKQFTAVTTVIENIETIWVFHIVGGSDPRLPKWGMKGAL